MKYPEHILQKIREINTTMLIPATNSETMGWAQTVRLCAPLADTGLVLVTGSKELFKEFLTPDQKSLYKTTFIETVHQICRDEGLYLCSMASAFDEISYYVLNETGEIQGSFLLMMQQVSYCCTPEQSAFFQRVFEPAADPDKCLINKIEIRASFGGKSVDTVGIMVPRPKCIPAQTRVLYPYFDFSIEKFWDGYRASNSNLLLMYGEPGTGKTAYIKQLVNLFGWGKNVYFVSTIETVTHPTFSTWLCQLPRGSVLVIDDADNLIRKRSDGNAAVTNLLTTLSGFIETDIKIILSTNLKNTTEIEPALLRPGRCYDILKFDTVTRNQAVKILETLGRPVELKVGERFTLAEVLNPDAKSHTSESAQFGFSAA